jgi:broad specificity phosphatase PhoE
MASLTTLINTLRHGKTFYNREKRYAGTIDIPLSEEGMREAKLLAAKIKEAAFDVVVSSHLRRAVETAQILVDGRAPIVQTPLCGERNFGIMEGLTWDEIQNLEPPILMISVGGDLHTVNPKGGEPFEDVWARAKRFRDFLFSNYTGKRILVVSHGVFMQMFHGVLKDSNCIESLGEFPSNLEMASFRFEAEMLVETRVFKFGGGDGLRW